MAPLWDRNTMLLEEYSSSLSVWRHLLLPWSENSAEAANVSSTTGRLQFWVACPLNRHPSDEKYSISITPLTIAEWVEWAGRGERGKEKGEIKRGQKRTQIAVLSKIKLLKWCQINLTKNIYLRNRNEIRGNVKWNLTFGAFPPFLLAHHCSTLLEFNDTCSLLSKEKNQHNKQKRRKTL